MQQRIQQDTEITARLAPVPDQRANRETGIAFSATLQTDGTVFSERQTSPFVFFFCATSLEVLESTTGMTFSLRGVRALNSLTITPHLSPLLFYYYEETI